MVQRRLARKSGGTSSRGALLAKVIHLGFFNGKTTWSDFRVALSSFLSQRMQVFYIQKWCLSQVEASQTNGAQPFSLVKQEISPIRGLAFGLMLHHVQLKGITRRGERKKPYHSTIQALRPIIQGSIRSQWALPCQAECWALGKGTGERCRVRQVQTAPLLYQYYPGKQQPSPALPQAQFTQEGLHLSPQTAALGRWKTGKPRASFPPSHTSYGWPWTLRTTQRQSDSWDDNCSWGIQVQGLLHSITFTQRTELSDWLTGFLAYHYGKSWLEAKSHALGPVPQLESLKTGLSQPRKQAAFSLVLGKCRIFQNRKILLSCSAAEPESFC